MAFDNLDTTANMENIIADKRQPSWISFLLVAIIVALLSAIGYVIWNNNKQFLIELDEKLEFSSNIILTFFNKLKKGLMGEVSESDEYIGNIVLLMGL